MSSLHITKGPTLGEPVPTQEVFNDLEADDTVITDCCVCKMSASDTVTRSGFQDWYGWTHVTKCAPDKGCNANPRKKCGAYLRAMSAGK